MDAAGAGKCDRSIRPMHIFEATLRFARHTRVPFEFLQDLFNVIRVILSVHLIVPKRPTKIDARKKE